jgi:hypothetical protein
MRLKIICSWIIIISWCLSAEVSLQRYSISTYVNTNAIEDGKLLHQSESNGSQLSVLRVGFRQYANPYINALSSLSLSSQMNALDYIIQDVFKGPFVHPNPLSLKNKFNVYYYLTKTEIIKVQIYNMFGRLVVQKIFPKGISKKSSAGHNLITIGPEEFRYYDVSAGVYFLLLIGENNKLLGKTKFAIVPEALN